MRVPPIELRMASSLARALELGKHEPGDVRHGDQQKQGDCPEDEEQSAAISGDASFFHIADNCGPALIRLRKLLGQVALDTRQVFLSLGGRHVRLHAANSDVKTGVTIAHEPAPSCAGIQTSMPVVANSFGMTPTMVKPRPLRTSRCPITLGAS